jgi:plastocyanin
MRKRSLPLVGALAFGLAVVAGALLSGRGIAASSDRGRVVTVKERDFKIAASTQRVAAGDVVFRVTNRGPDAHELIVIRAPGQLPLRSDGITVDEERLEAQTVTVRESRVRLRPGRYVLLCNMYGHFMGGMYAVVLVR